MWVHPKGPLCHLPAVTEVSVENLSCGLCVLPTPTASSIDPDAPPAEDAGWVLGRMLSTGQAARQRRAAEYQMPLPASASESASPWQLALPDAPRTQDRHVTAAQPPS